MFDPEEDLHGDNASVWTGTRTILLRVVRRAYDLDTRIEGVRRHMVTATEAEMSGGAYVARDCVFNFPSADVLHDPEVGYPLVDGDTTWTIFQVDDASQSSRWRCTCRNFALTDGLSDTIEIWTPTHRKDAAGGELPEFLPRHQGVQAKVQELSGANIDEAGRDGTQTDYRVFVAQRLFVDKEDQVRWIQRGEPPMILEFQSFEAPDSLTRLQVMNCRRGLW